MQFFLKESRFRNTFPISVLLSLLLLSLGVPARAQLDPDQQKCVRELNKGFVKVAKARAKQNLKCLKGAAKAKLTNTLADCLAADSVGRIQRVENKTVAGEKKKCAAAAPPFGKTDAITVNEAALARELLLTYDLFNGPIDRAIIKEMDGKQTSNCQQRLMSQAKQCQATRYREFNTCKTRGLKKGTIRDAVDLAACMDADPKGRIAKACDAELTGRIAKECAGVDLTMAFPGCSASDPVALRGCIDESVACGVCAALNRADDLTQDCDGFDNDLNDESCTVCPPEGPLPIGTALYDDLLTYVSFGIRRTGTPGATNSATWLADELTSLGFAVELQPFSFTQFDYDPAGSSLAVDGVSYDFVPLWFPSTGTVSAELALYDEGDPSAVSGKVALLTVTARILTDQSPTHLAIEAAITNGAVAVVAINRFRAEAAALNAHEPFNETPWAVPVVIVGDKHRTALEDSAGKPVTVTIAGTAGPGSASNVIGRWTPTPGVSTFVVSTPYTGWFTTAGERGPGISLFLGLARWVAERNSGANYIFVSVAGMELGSLGERVFLDPLNLPPEPDDVIAWIHLGAGIVTYGVVFDGTDYVQTTPEYSFSISTPGELASIIDCALAHAGTFPAVPPAFAGGSLAVIFDEGYNAVGLQTTNDLYHTAEDTMGRNTPDAALLQPVGVGLLRALVALGG